MMDADVFRRFGFSAVPEPVVAGPQLPVPLSPSEQTLYRQLLIESIRSRLGLSCSVENPLLPDDHHVERQRSEVEFAALGVMTSSPERRAQQSLEHTVDGLDLPTLRVAGAFQDAGHAAAPKAARAFLRRATDQGRNERVHAALFAGVLMRVLGVVTGVGDERVDPKPGLRFVERAAEVFDVGPGASARHERQDEMTARIAQHAGLGKRFISDFLPEFTATGAALHEVAAHMMRLPAGAVERRQTAARRQELAAPREAERLVEQAMHARRQQQAIGRFLEGREVRHGLQLDRGRQLRRVAEHGRELAIATRIANLSSDTGAIGLSAFQVRSIDKNAFGRGHEQSQLHELS